VLLEGLCQITPSGIKPMSFQLLAQCLHQLHRHVLQQHEIKIHFNKAHSLVVYICVCVCVCIYTHICTFKLPIRFNVIQTHPLNFNIYRVSQEEWTKLQESVPYVKIYQYNPKHLCPKLNGYRDKGQRKVWSFCGSMYCTWFA